MKEYKFTEQEIYNRMLYFAYCHYFEFEHNIKSCETHQNFVAFVTKEATKHAGDCTKLPCPCSMCALNQIEIIAQNMTDSMMSDGDGWCNKKCFTDCQGAYEEDGEMRKNKDEKRI